VLGTIHEVKLSLYTMKAYKRSRGTAPLTFNLGTRWRWVVNIMPQPLHLTERTLAPTEQSGRWASEPLWMFLELTSTTMGPNKVLQLLLYTWYNLNNNNNTTLHICIKIHY